MIKRVCLLCAIVLVMLPNKVHASVSADAELSEMVGVEAIEGALVGEQRELLGQVSATEAPDFIEAVQHLLSRAVLQAADYVPQSLRAAGAILAVCAICGMVGSISLPGNTQQIAGVAALAAAMFANIKTLIGVSTETVHSLATYAELLLPALGTAAAASGAITAGPAIYGITVLFSNLLLTAITHILIPLLYVFLALSAADAALGGTILHRFCALTAWAAKALLKTVLFSFTAFLTVSQIIAGTGDVLTAKAAKVTISGMIPVVGSIISDASDTILASAAILKSSIGVFGMLSILAIAVVPILRIGIHCLTVKITAAIGSALAPKALISMIDSIEQALGLILAATGSCALILLISAVCSLRVVGL